MFVPACEFSPVTVEKSLKWKSLSLFLVLSESLFFFVHSCYPPGISLLFCSLTLLLALIPPNISFSLSHSPLFHPDSLAASAHLPPPLFQLSARKQLEERETKEKEEAGEDRGREERGSLGVTE